MSSMRNAVQRRNHKERAQPLEREKWGVLEKHKDYSLRAKDYNEKKKRLKILRQKAADRNPDEFHFGMMSSKTHNGGQKLADRGNKVLSHDAVKLLKTQDAGYLRTMAQRTRKERERLEEEYILGEGDGVVVLGGNSRGSDGQHTIYVESTAEQKRFNPAEFFATTADGLHKKYNRPRVEQRVFSDIDHGAEYQLAQPKDELPKSTIITLPEERARKEARALRKRHKREQQVRKSKLEALKVRERDLVVAEQALELQRAKMSNSIGGVTKAGMKWKVRERKK
ncbi:MAG: U3 snoRNP-associated Utp11 [Lasallia pustulata]|uniref:U3 small nucleolar RNA-associated protein 11 n=1 Tax=Lasallia pustulata TaxID=136370 RepID=A0A5M8Q4L7_9LECA|nr:MAG: U3 snoRNP-associated Utp11 [Lasallia pustulata]